MCARARVRVRMCVCCMCVHVCVLYMCACVSARARVCVCVCVWWEQESLVSAATETQPVAKVLTWWDRVLDGLVEKSWLEALQGPSKGP